MIASPAKRGGFFRKRSRTSRAINRGYGFVRTRAALGAGLGAAALAGAAPAAGGAAALGALAATFGLMPSEIKRLEKRALDYKERAESLAGEYVLRRGRFGPLRERQAVLAKYLDKMEALRKLTIAGKAYGQINDKLISVVTAMLPEEWQGAKLANAREHRKFARALPKMLGIMPDDVNAVYRRRVVYLNNSGIPRTAGALVLGTHDEGKFREGYPTAQVRANMLNRQIARGPISRAGLPSALRVQASRNFAGTASRITDRRMRGVLSRLIKP